MELLYRAAMIYENQELLDDYTSYHITSVFSTLYELRQQEFHEMTFEDIYLYWKKEFLLEQEEGCETDKSSDTK